MTDISPDRFIDDVFAYQKTAAVKAAIELDLFSAIGAGATSVDALAANVGAAPRGVRILCDYLTVQELLIKEGSRYRLTPSRDSPAARRKPCRLRRKRWSCSVSPRRLATDRRQSP